MDDLMQRDNIIRMAEQCGIPEFENNESQADNIMKFAQLVAKKAVEAEREACVRAADDQWVKDPHISGGDAIRKRR